ncbi:MAG: hypothetical protein WKG03_21935 [Telluria sp.]
MTLPSKTALVLTLAVTFSLSACKPKPGEPTAEQKAQTAAAAASVPAAAPAPATVAAPVAAPAQSNPAAIADLAKIATLAKPMPPFPFIDYPSAVGEAFQGTDESDFDQLAVVVGDKLHMVEGRFRLIRFDLKDAKLSEFQAKRDYAKAALDMGGVKVNTVLPKDDAFYAANKLTGESEAAGKVRYDLDKKTKYESHHTYDAYFFPTATGRKWLVVMIDDSHARLLSIEEKTAESAVKLVAAK